MVKSIDYRQALIEELRANPGEAAAYLEAALAEFTESRDAEAFLLALRTVAEVKGGITSLAKKTKLTRQSLYKALSSDGNPRLDTIGAILHSLGYGLSVRPL